MKRHSPTKIQRLAGSVATTLIAIGLLTGANSARAQEAEAQPVSPVKQRASAADDTQEILVTARRVEENLQQVPLSVTAIGADMLRQQSTTELRDIARVVPNLYFQQAFDSSALIVSIRGQSQIDSYLNTDNSVGIYIDGINVPRNQGLRAALVDLERIEVLRGPQGTLYGRNTTGGAVGLITKDPTDRFEGSISGTYGSYDYVSGTAILNVPISDTLRARFVAHHSQRDGYARTGSLAYQLGGPSIPFPNGDGIDQDVADDNVEYFRAKLKYESGPFSAMFSADYTEQRTSAMLSVFSTQNPVAAGPSGMTDQALLQLGLPATPTNYAYVAGILNSCRRSPTGGGEELYRSCSAQLFNAQTPPYNHYRGFGASATLAYEISDGIDIKSITGYRMFRRRAAFDADGTPFVFIHQFNNTKDQFFQQELQILGSSDTLDWIAGLYVANEWGTEEVNAYVNPGFSPAGIPQSGNYNQAPINNDSYAAYAQASWKFAPRFSLTLGARYTIEEKRIRATNQVINASGAMITCYTPVQIRPDPTVCRGDQKIRNKAPTWIASLDFQATDDVMFYGKIARGFRAGGLNYRAVNLAAATPYDPEYVTEYELGMKSHLFNRALRLNLTGYYDNYTGVQRATVQCLNVGTGTCQIASLIANATSATVKGVEAEAMLRVVRGFHLTGNLGYTDAKYKAFPDVQIGDRSTEPFPYPEFSYSLGAQYVAPTGVGDLTLRADYSWRSKVVLKPEALYRDTVTAPAHEIINLRMALAIDAWDTEVAVYGRNLTDQRVPTSASTGDRTPSLGFSYNFIGIDPRTFGVSLMKRF